MEYPNFLLRTICCNLNLEYLSMFRMIFLIILGILILHYYSGKSQYTFVLLKLNPNPTLLIKCEGNNTPQHLDPA